MKRRIFSVLLSSALLLTALAGCGQGGEAAPSGSSSDADSETGTRDELIFVNYRDIRDLNPHLYAGEMYAQSILYDTLVSNTEDGYVGCLAEDWTISDDGRIYTFNIRDGVTFSDGTPCDANAILANFNAILENRERSATSDGVMTPGSKSKSFFLKYRSIDSSTDGVRKNCAPACKAESIRSMVVAVPAPTVTDSLKCSFNAEICPAPSGVFIATSKTLIPPRRILSA